MSGSIPCPADILHSNKSVLLKPRRGCGRSHIASGKEAVSPKFATRGKEEIVAARIDELSFEKE
jgi:hypothetical protein